MTPIVQVVFRAITVAFAILDLYIAEDFAATNLVLVVQDLMNLNAYPV